MCAALLLDEPGDLVTTALVIAETTYLIDHSGPPPHGQLLRQRRDRLHGPAVSITLTPPADLAAMALPSLVLSGSASHPSFRSVAYHLVTALRDARFVELEGSEHVTYAERPDEFENAVRVFAGGLDVRIA